MRFKQFLSEQTETDLFDFVVPENDTTDYHEVFPGRFDVSYMGIEKMKNAPKHIQGYFNCARNLLTSLEGGPEIVDEYYSAIHNQLTTLKGCPKIVLGQFSVANNDLTEIDYFPDEVGSFSASENKITNLHDIHKKIKKVKEGIWLNRNPIKSHILGLCLIPGLTKVYLDNHELQSIINTYLFRYNEPSHASRKANLFEVQEELIDAGYEQYAQL